MRKKGVGVLAMTLAVTWLIGMASSVRAQVDTGTVLGTVRDQSGAVIPKAKVTLTNEGTSISVSTLTQNDGTYVFSPVRVGTYSVTAEFTGFSRVIRLHIPVNIQQHVVINLTLTPGALTQSVSVTAPAPVLQTQSGSVGQLVGSRDINNLPLNGRNYTFLAQLVPGVTRMQQDDRGLADSGSFAANGTTYAQTNYILNGLDNNNTQPDLIGGSTYAVLPPIDALQEFKVETSDYSAEFGRAGGAVINATVKSGTNQIHGDAWEFLRNDALDAADFFENAGNQAKSEFRRNQFGLTLGGPVTIPPIYSGKDHTFFFIDYEGTRVRQGLPEVETVPTLAERNSGFADLSDLLAGQPGTTPADLLGRTFSVGQVFDPATTRPVIAGQTDPVTGLVATGNGYVREPFPGNILPAGRIDPNAVKLLELFPLPTAGGIFNNYTASPVEQAGTNSFDGRIDETLSDRDQTFVTFDYNHTGMIKPPPFPGVASGGSDFTRASDAFTALTAAWSETHTFSSTTVNEFRVGFTRLATPFDQFGSDTLGVPAQFGIQGIPQVPGNGGLPSMGIGFYQRLGVWGFLPTFKDSNVWDIRENLTRIQGAHTLKAGFEYQNNFIPFLIPPFPRGYFDFTGAYTSIPGANLGTTGPAQFLLAPIPSLVPGGINNVGGSDLVMASDSVNSTEVRHYYAAYVQDDWKTTSKLTLNLGLRYEHYSPYLNRYDAQANFIPGAPFAGAQYLYPADRRNNPTLPPVFLQTLAKDGVALNLTDNVAGEAPPIDFAPRFGFAYSVSSKLVVRGGYGISFSGMQISSGGDHWGTNDFPFLFNYSFPAPDPDHPITSNNSIGLLENGMLNIALTPSALKNGAGFNVIGRQYKFSVPYVQAANLTAQYQLTPNETVQIGYVGSFGRHLEITPGANEVSKILPPLVNYISFIPYPDLAPGFTYVTDSASSYYHSLQATFERRFNNGLSILGDYTWSKCRTDARDNLENDIGGYRAPYIPGFGIQGDYALCDFDVRNLAHLSGTYELPFGQGRKFLANSSRWLDGMMGGWVTNWILTLQDGMPLTVPCNISTAAGVTCDALLAPGQNVIGGEHSVNQWMNPKAFTNPPIATTIGETDYAPLGGAPTQLVGPGFHRLDFSLFKQFRTSEKTRLEFRAEFFNIFNIPNFAAPTNLDFSSPAFGAITSTIDNPNDPREIQFGLKFYW
jgi:hypothetical protein